jgi:hypothetical protein
MLWARDTALSKLAEQYFITCHTEGKTPSAIRGCQEKLGRFIRCCYEACLSHFSGERAREYITCQQPATVLGASLLPYHRSSRTRAVEI